VLGEYLNVSAGRAYHAFAEDNVAPLDFDAALPLVWSMDFNVDPMCSVLLQEHGGEIRVIDELFLRDSNTLAACQAFVERTAAWPKPIEVRVYGDASGNSRSSKAARSDYELVREFFRAMPEYRVVLRVPLANPSVKDRVNAVNAQLCSASGSRRLLIDARCKQLVTDFRQVAWSQGATVDLDKRSDKLRTHLSDALGYYVHREHPVSAFQRKITTN
jgi:hypothetical protein